MSGKRQRRRRREPFSRTGRARASVEFWRIAGYGCASARQDSALPTGCIPSHEKSPACLEKLSLPAIARIVSSHPTASRPELAPLETRHMGSDGSGGVPGVGQKRRQVGDDGRI